VWAAQNEEGRKRENLNSALYGRKKKYRRTFVKKNHPRRRSKRGGRRGGKGQDLTFPGGGRNHLSRSGGKERKTRLQEGVTLLLKTAGGDGHLSPGGPMGRGEETPALNS